jgi:hypothetical protein
MSLRWTDDEIRELVALWPTNSLVQIAITLHRPPGGIYAKAKELRKIGLVKAKKACQNKIDKRRSTQVNPAGPAGFRRSEEGLLPQAPHHDR